MCGIVGVAGQADEGIVHRMTEIIYHRGPDDGGTAMLNGGQVCLGNRRLSILDLSSAGHQPMSLGDTLWITYNGEIYNFMDIRHELENKGHQFKTKTDTEVLLHAYQEWGIECLQRFSGMYAFALWDDREKQLILARDRFGIKPLYYTTVDGSFYFASEFKAFYAIPGFRARLSRDGLYSILQFLWVADPLTILEGVYHLPAGHYLVLKDGQVTEHMYWDIPVEPPVERDVDGLTETLQKHLTVAVRRSLVSDVPIGILLSGGIDSGGLVALARRAGADPVRTYTITFSGDDMLQEAMPDDSKYARQVSELFETDHREILLEPDIVDLMPMIIWHLDEPLADPAAINTYLIAKRAKEDGVSVLLLGAGPDEIFAGYRKHIATLMTQYYSKLPRLIRKGLIERYLKSADVAHEERGRRLVRWAKRFVASAGSDPISNFTGLYSYYSPAELNQVLADDWKFQGLHYSIRKHFEMFEQASPADFVNQMCYVDIKLFLANLNLMYPDKAMMAASVEGRPPYLDHELVEFAAGIPGKLKIRRGEQKYILKRAFRGVLPRNIIYRPKAPFGAPLRAWMRKQLFPMLNDLYSEEAVKGRGIFNYRSIRQMISDNYEGRHDYAHRLWGLLALELWFQQFIDRQGNVSGVFPHEQGARALR
jgi:asparagine synthase (glutamine-hydrolysing)